MTNSWRAEAVAGFLPISGDPAPARPVASVRGDGRGRLETHVLVRPGAAAALVVPRDDATAVSGPVLTPLRARCPASRPVVAALGRTAIQTQGELVAAILTACNTITAAWRGPDLHEDPMCGS